MKLDLKFDFILFLYKFIWNILWFQNKIELIEFSIVKYLFDLLRVAEIILVVLFVKLKDI